MCPCSRPLMSSTFVSSQFQLKQLITFLFFLFVFRTFYSAKLYPLPEMVCCKKHPLIDTQNSGSEPTPRTRSGFSGTSSRSRRTCSSRRSAPSRWSSLQIRAFPDQSSTSPGTTTSSARRCSTRRPTSFKSCCPVTT